MRAILVLMIVLLNPVASLAQPQLPEQLWLGNQTVNLADGRVFYRVYPKVQFLLGYAQSTARCLAQAKVLFPVAHQKLQEQGVPLAMSYLIAAESCGRLDAVSTMGAQGPWQGMVGTAAPYGYSWWDLRDPQKSSEFAARHLKDLYEQFGDWLLVLSAWNSGEETVQLAIERSGARDFWQLPLPYETAQFVPTVLAYMIIDTQSMLGDVRYPGVLPSYSFELPSRAPAMPNWPELATVKLKIKGRVRISHLAQLGEVPLVDLLRFNPHLNFQGWNLVFLPQGKTINIRVPKDIKSHFLSNLQQNLSRSLEVQGAPAP